MTSRDEDDIELSGTRRQQPRDDFRSLKLASSYLAKTYQGLSPRLKDPEKVLLRYSRAQQQAQWIVSNFRPYLPEDFVFHFESRIGRGYPSSPFDDSIPTKRAVLRLRKLIRELLRSIASTAESMSEERYGV